MVGKSILIVDDNPASRTFPANHLKGKQFKVLEAPTGKEGLFAARRDQPDLILFGPALHDIADQEFIILDIGRSFSRISLPLIQKADLIVLVVSTDQSTVKLTKTIWDYFQTQGIGSQKIYAILNRAIGLEGLTKAQAEEMIGLYSFHHLQGNRRGYGKPGAPPALQVRRLMKVKGNFQAISTKLFRQVPLM